MLPLLLVLMPFWLLWLASQGDPEYATYACGFVGVLYGLYVGARRAEKKKSLTEDQRKMTGRMLFVCTVLTFISIIIAQPPVTGIVLSLACVPLLIEGYRMRKGWKLFFPIKK